VFDDLATCGGLAVRWACNQQQDPQGHLWLPVDRPCPMQIVVYPNQIPIPLMENSGLPKPPSGMLELTVQRAANLRSKDFTGGGDPFVVISVHTMAKMLDKHGKEHEIVAKESPPHTSSVLKGKNPEFNEHFKVCCMPFSLLCRCSRRVESLCSKHGHVRYWSAAGFQQLKLRFARHSMHHRAKHTPIQTGPFVELPLTTGLPRIGSSRRQLRSDLSFSTATLPALGRLGRHPSKHPKTAPRLQILVPALDGKHRLAIRVYDKDLIGDDDVLGEYDIPLDKAAISPDNEFLRTGEEVQLTYNLKPKAGTPDRQTNKPAGELFCMMQYTMFFNATGESAGDEDDPGKALERLAVRTVPADCLSPCGHSLLDVVFGRGMQHLALLLHGVIVRG
jgi:hypothetical protein